MDEASALERLRSVLAQPAFLAPEHRSLRDRLVRAAWDLIYDFVMGFITPAASAADAGGTEGGLQWTVMLAWAVVIFALLAFAWRALRLTVLATATGSAPDARLRRERSDELWREAHDLAAAGRLQDAARALYLSALYALDERGLLRVRPGQTNREHALAAAQAHPEASGAFADLVERYDRVRYGGYPVSRQAFAELSKLAERTRAAQPA